MDWNGFWLATQGVAKQFWQLCLKNPEPAIAIAVILCMLIILACSKTAKHVKPAPHPVVAKASGDSQEGSEPNRSQAQADVTHSTVVPGGQPESADSIGPDGADGADKALLLDEGGRGLKVTQSDVDNFVGLWLLK